MNENNSEQSPIQGIDKDSFLMILQYLGPSDFGRVAKISRAANTLVENNWHLAFPAIPDLKNYIETEKIAKDQIKKTLMMYFSIKKEMRLPLLFWTINMKPELLLLTYLRKKQVEKAIFMIKTNLVARFDQTDALHKKSHCYMYAAAVAENFELFELLINLGASIIDVENKLGITFDSTGNQKIKSLIGILRAENCYRTNRPEAAIENFIQSYKYDSAYLKQYIMKVREEKKGFQIEYSVTQLQGLEACFSKIIGIDQSADTPVYANLSSPLI